MTDLDKLIDAVEGEDIDSAMPLSDEQFRLLRVWSYIYNAYNGSLDAAKALHEALLPGWDWGRDPNGYNWVSMHTNEIGCADNGDTPARAWLLAILKAYRSQVQK